MKNGGHVRFFLPSSCRAWLVFHAKFVENLHFRHVERGLTISKATDTSLEICGLAAVQFFWSDTPREGPGGGGKKAYFCWKSGKPVNQLGHPILRPVPQELSSMTWPSKARGLSRTRVKGQGHGQGQRSTWQRRIALCMTIEESGRYSPVMGLNSLGYRPWGKATYLGSGSSVTLRVKGQGQD